MSDPPSNNPTNSQNLYIKEKMRADTAYEINESQQNTYKHDLIYIFFKLLLFVILGVVFYYLFKNQSPAELLEKVKEKSDEALVVVDKTTNLIKEKVKAKI